MDKWLFYQRGGEQEGEETGEEEEEEGEGARLLSRRQTGQAPSSGSTPTRRGGLGHSSDGTSGEQRRTGRTGAPCALFRRGATIPAW